jgi:uncharacterized iron-regulated membrane protein
MARTAFRQFLLVTHRWIGIVAALFLVIVSVTGAILVYEQPLERWVHRSLYHVTPGERMLSYDSLLAVAQNARPRKVPVHSIIVSPAPDVATRVQYQFHWAFVDPYRGTVIGERDMGSSVIVQARLLHHSLLFEQRGRVVMQTATIASLLLTLGGVLLWWPRRIWRVTRTRSWRGVNFDLHNVLGIAAVAGVLIFGGTAVMMQFGGGLDPLYRRAWGDAPPVQMQPASPRRETHVSIDSIVRAANGVVPGPLREILIPVDRHGTYRLSYQTPGEYGNRARNLVWVDGNDGRVRASIDQNTRPMGTRVAMLVEDWHIAAFAPGWSRTFGLISCLLLAFEGISGPLIWWRPRRRRARVRPARTARADETA